MPLSTLPLLQDPNPTTPAPADGGGTFVEESFRFLAAPPAWVLVLVVMPATVLFAWWSYGGLQRLEPRTRVTLAALRWLAIAVCCVLLFQPAWEITTYRRTQNQVHVLIDDSASMQRKDRYPAPEQHDPLQALLPGVDVGTLSRREVVAAVLGRSDGLLAKLAKTHDVRLFRVQRKPSPIRDLAELTARGNRTTLGDALDLHLAAAAGSNLDAVVLVSDGRNNAGLDPVAAAEGYALRGIPIHTVGVGDPEAPRNAWIVGPPGPKEALCLEQVGFEVTLRAEGLRGQRARVELHGARDGGAFTTLATASAELPDAGQSAQVRLFHAFDQAGDWTLRFVLAPLPEESQLDDNEDTRFLRVNDEKIRVLFVDDRPRWEYRYLQNGLKRVDPSIVMQAYLFDASPRFQQERSKELPPLRDLPRTEKELFQYHVILFGDVAPESLAPSEEKRREWMEMVVRFVEFGGGVGFLYGSASMPERYRNTPLQDLLPVVLEDRAWLQANKPRRDVEFRPRLENPTQPHDILLLQRDPAFNRRVWEQGLPGFYVYHPVERAKPGATVLLRHPTDGNTYGKRPIAVVGPYPRGNTFFLATDETWRWRDPYAEVYMDAFWRNVVRYLAQGRLQRRNDFLELTVDKTQVETNDKVRVQLRVQDDELQPAVAAEQPIFLRDQRDKVEKRVLRAVPGEPGTYQATFTMADAGAFSFLVFANHNPADTVLAREDVLVRMPDREMSESAQDADALRRIAAASHGTDGSGRYVFLAGADALLADFAQRKSWESREDTRTRPAWDSLAALLLVLALLAAEWLLRKRARLV
jgi:uncharacterized membrane protein